MKKFISIILALTFVIAFGCTAVAFADETPATPRVINSVIGDTLSDSAQAVLVAKVAAGKDGDGKTTGSLYQIEKSSSFEFYSKWAWTKEGEATTRSYNVSAICEILPEFQADNGEGGTFADKVYIECRSQSSSSWQSKEITANAPTFSVTNDGIYLFRYKFVLKNTQGNDDIIIYSAIMERTTTDTTAPIIKPNYTTYSFEAGTAKAIPSADKTDCSSVTINYVLYKKNAQGDWTKIYDSETKEVTQGYETIITADGMLTALDSDVIALESERNVYKVVYSGKDAYGNVATNDEAERTMYIYVTAKASNNPTGETTPANKTNVLRIVLIVIASLSAVGIVVLLLINPEEKQQQVAGRVHYASDSAEKQEPTEEPAEVSEEPTEEQE